MGNSAAAHVDAQKHVLQQSQLKRGQAISEEVKHVDLKHNGLSVRRMTKEDLKDAANICQEAFNSFNACVNLAPEFPPQEVVDVPSFLLGLGLSEGFQGFVVTNEAGDIVGSNIVELRDEVAGIGPISVASGIQNGGAGKLLMQACMKAAAEKNFERVRLHAILANTKSYSLYLSLGFDPQCSCGHYEGFCSAESPSGFTCQPLSEEVVEACSALHLRTAGTHRRHDIKSMIGSPHPNCVVKDPSQRVVAYSTGCFLSGHTVAENIDAFKALVCHQSRAIKAAQDGGAPIPPITFFVPHNYTEMSRWLVSNGFRLSRQVVQMSYGPHSQPEQGIYCPAIQY